MLQRAMAKKYNTGYGLHLIILGIYLKKTITLLYNTVKLLVLCVEQKYRITYIHNNCKILLNMV